MEHRCADVAIVGLGIAGMAILRSFRSIGVKCLGIDARNPHAASFNNQRWRHSGLHYEFPAPQRLLWEAARNVPSIERNHHIARGSVFFASDPLMLQHRITAGVFANDHIRKINTTDSLPALGPPRAAYAIDGGDIVVDYGKLVDAMRFDLADNIVTATVTQIRPSDAGFEVCNTNAQTVFAQTVVVAAGSWAPELLTRSNIRIGNITLERSTLMTIPTPVVPCITAWVDEHRLTLVPFRGRTLVGNTEREVVRTPRFSVPDVDRTWFHNAMQVAFPRMNPSALDGSLFHSCVKVDCRDTKMRNWGYTILGPAAHGVSRLFVVFPGKASLAWSLADTLTKQSLQT